MWAYIIFWGFLVLLLYPYVLSIFELFVKETRGRRKEKFRNWIKNVTPNKTQREALLIACCLFGLFWAYFLR